MNIYSNLPINKLLWTLIRNGNEQNSSRLKKRPLADRESCVSRYNGGPIKASLTPLITIVL